MCLRECAGRLGSYALSSGTCRGQPAPYPWGMHAVINTLRFKDSVDPAVFTAAEQELAQRMGAIDGFRSFQVIQVADDHVVLVIVGDDADVLERVATEVGSPWMGANVVPLLAAPPERRIGPVIASAG